MAVTQETLAQWFLQSLSPDPDPRHRRAAEASLAASADAPGFSFALLNLLGSPSPSLQLLGAPSPSLDDSIRLAAAIHFKNHLRSHWSTAPSADDDAIPDSEKDQIKAFLPHLMLAAPPRIQSQLAESLAVVSTHDFPGRWRTLLPELVGSLRSASAAGDYRAVKGLLAASDSLFSKFRHSCDTQALRLDLKYCLDQFARPLLDVFLATSRRISAGVIRPLEALRPLFESQCLCCEIFRSLNSVYLPEFFENHMQEWMGEFRTYLEKRYPPALEVEGTADALRAAVCKNLDLYMKKNEEEFKHYLKDFASSVWNLLMTPGASPSLELLVVNGIKFLTTVSTSLHHALFAEVLPQILQSIVFPNISLGDEEEELFKMDYMEYIHRDIEGSDVDTRRRIASELLKGIAMNYKERVTELVLTHIGELLKVYTANPQNNWKQKDSAIYLVVSLAPMLEASNLETFFTSYIIPELQQQDVDAAFMLKASALKFFMMFRDHISKPVALALFPHLVRFLVSESNVVHSYAANCIEKLLVMGVVPGPNVVATHCWYGALDIEPFMQQLMLNLLRALQFSESRENPYIMKCLMRVLEIGNLSDEFSMHCIASLVELLAEACKQPKNQTFIHYLFESISALIRRSCEKDQSLVFVFEEKLFPVLQKILVDDDSDFWPYTFQIFAQLVEMSTPPLSNNYMQLFQVLILPDAWKRSGNAPALVLLLQAYLQKVPNELKNEGRLPQVIQISMNLLSDSRTEEFGFYVLNTVVENVGSDTVASYLHNIWTAVFTRLQSQQTIKFVNSLVIFMSLVLVKHGPLLLVDSINTHQKGLFFQILSSFWIPNLKLIRGSVEVKLASVSATKLICESQVFSDSSLEELWGKMLDSIITVLSKEVKSVEETEDAVPDDHETLDYSTAFARLQNVGRKEQDLLKEINDPKEFLVKSLATISVQTPDKYHLTIDKYLDPSNQAVLLQLFVTYNCVII